MKLYEIFEYLDAAKGYGITNMLSGVAVIAETFHIPNIEARKAITKWLLINE